MSSNPQSRLPDRAGKIIFADQLRAVAALSVMIVHLLGTYWFGRDTVALHIAAPVVEGPAASSLKAISFTWFNFGPFGVSLFFLVSGFVIPFSVARTTRLRFLAARALRIYPTYIACLALAMTVVWLSSLFWKMPLPWDLRQVVGNAALVQSIAAIDSMDMVNWSLAVEIKFYLVACMAAHWIRRGQTIPLILVAAALAGGILVQTQLLPAGWQLVPLPWLPLHLEFLSHDLMFIPFMFAGTMFAFHFRGQISARELLAGIAVLLAIFLFAWRQTILKDFFPLVPLNYVYALCVFAGAYALRDHCRPNRAVDWFASVSYPVYALHTLVGYTVIRFLTAVGIGYYLAVVIAVAVVLVLAYGVHRAVEVPTQESGRRLMRRQTGAAGKESCPAGA